MYDQSLVGLVRFRVLELQKEFEIEYEFDFGHLNDMRSAGILIFSMPSMHMLDIFTGEYFSTTMCTTARGNGQNNLRMR